MNTQLFHVGDEVVVIGNVNDDKNDIGWGDSMDDMVGEIFTIDIVDNDGETFMYKLKEDEYHWWFDEDWLRLYDVLEVDTHELDSFFGDFGGE